MSDLECFSYVNSNNNYLEKKGITRVKPCKECEVLEKCVAAYNERVYNEWLEQDLDDDDWDFVADQEVDEQELIKWGEMMAEQEQDELNNPDESMLDDWRGVQ